MDLPNYFILEIYLSFNKCNAHNYSSDINKLGYRIVFLSNMSMTNLNSQGLEVKQ